MLKCREYKENMVAIAESLRAITHTEVAKDVEQQTRRGYNHRLKAASTSRDLVYIGTEVAGQEEYFEPDNKGKKSSDKLPATAHLRILYGAMEVFGRIPSVYQQHKGKMINGEFVIETVHDGNLATTSPYSSGLHNLDFHGLHHYPSEEASYEGESARIKIDWYARGKGKTIIDETKGTELVLDMPVKTSLEETTRMY